MLAACRKNVTQGLTDRGISLILNSPKIVRGVAIAVSQSPTVKKVLPAHTAIFHALGGAVSAEVRVYVGRVATSRTREGWQSLTDWGALFNPASFFNPETVRGFYVPEI